MRLYVVEAKRWPAYSESKFKKLTLSNLNKFRREFRTLSLEDDFVEEYRFEERVWMGRSWSGGISRKLKPSRSRTN